MNTEYNLMLAIMTSCYTVYGVYDTGLSDECMGDLADCLDHASSMSHAWELWSNNGLVLAGSPA